MRKVAKREIIVLGVAAIAVLYGVVSFIMGGPNKKAAFPTAMKSVELNNLTNNINTAMRKDVLSVWEAYAIARAETEWTHDPFFEKRAYREMFVSKELPKAGPEGAKKAAFNYTGYMEFHGKKIAIINGVEYNVGESLETPGYVVRNILPDKVIIENSAARSRMEIPIQD